MLEHKLLHREATNAPSCRTSADGRQTKDPERVADLGIWARVARRVVLLQLGVSPGPG